VGRVAFELAGSNDPMITAAAKLSVSAGMDSELATMRSNGVTRPKP